MADTDFDNQLSEKQEMVNGVLSQVLAEPGRIADGMVESIRYTLEAPGKRLRGTLVLWSCELVSGSVNRDAEIVAAAVEMVHTYSLVHDDLPAMDDDNLRRGRPTCHKAFDEATAILAGDGLLTLAFELLSEKIDEPSVSVRLISELSKAAGPTGMIAGQLADFKGENAKPARELLEYIHLNKTAKMFRAAAAMGAIAGGASDSEFESLCEFGLKIGLGFQIADDLLDVLSCSEELGKTAGKDAKAGKMTYPALIGIEESRKLEKRFADEAIAAIEPFGDKAEVLRQLALALLERIK